MMSKPARGRPSATADSVLEKSIIALDVAVDMLSSEIAKIAAGRGSKSKFDRESRLAHLAGRLGPIADTVRKIQAGQSKRLEAMTPSMVIAWLQQLPRDEREQFIADITAINQKRSGLG